MAGGGEEGMQRMRRPRETSSWCLVASERRRPVHDSYPSIRVRLCCGSDSGTVEIAGPIWTCCAAPWFHKLMRGPGHDVRAPQTSALRSWFFLGPAEADRSAYATQKRRWNR